MTKKILIVEDCPVFRQALSEHLSTFYDVTPAEDAETALFLLQRDRYDLIVIDLGLPGMDGHQFCAHLKADPTQSEIPILILSGQSEIEKKLISFSLGVQDFLCKPVDSRELRARIHLQLKTRDLQQTENRKFQIGPFEGDLTKQDISYWAQGEKFQIPLSQLEFRLIHFFLTHLDHVLSREQLLDHVWGSARHVSDRSVDACICKLRRKLGPYASLLQAVHGAGYKLNRLLKEGIADDDRI